MAGTLDETVTVYCDGDFRYSMPTVSGRVALAQRLKTRLTTRRGKVPWWPNFGTDLRAFLLSKVPAQQIADAAKFECEKDEQVERADCAADIAADGKALTMIITIWDSEGPFVFTMTIGEAVTSLIELQRGA